MAALRGLRLSLAGAEDFLTHPVPVICPACHAEQAYSPEGSDDPT